MSDRREKNDVAALSRKGYQLLKRSEYLEAARCFGDALEIEQGNCYALVGLGDISRKQGRPADAVGYYERCLDHDPDNAFALFGLADSYRALRKHHEALKVWERYLQHDNENVAVLTRVADAYRKVREKRKSEAIYRRVLELDHENPYALIGLGHLHYDFREYEEALECWLRMYELRGSEVDIRVLTSIGNSYRKLKRFSEAIPFFNEALDKEANNFYALFGLADCYRGLNEADRSLHFWNRILERDPENKVILTRAGDAHRSMGEIDAAERCYRKALAIGDDLYAALGLAVVSRTGGDHATAASLLEELRRRHPDAYRVHTELAATYAQAGRPGDAVEVLSSYPAQGTEHTHLQQLIERYRQR